jgi:ribonuclease VapC
MTTGDEEPETDPDESDARDYDRYRSVLDASAGLALLFGEPGAERVADRVAEGAVMTTVNLTEIGTVLIRRGLDWKKILFDFRGQVGIEPVFVADALAATQLYPAGERAGLSLGDRHCLALARRLKLPAVTTEQAWRDLELGVEIDVVRGASDN